MKARWKYYIGIILAIYAFGGIKELMTGKPSLIDNTSPSHSYSKEKEPSKVLKMVEYVLLKNEGHVALDCKEKTILGKKYIRCDYSAGSIGGYRKKLLFEARGDNDIKAINGSSKLPELLKYDEITEYDPGTDGVIDVSVILDQF